MITTQKLEGILEGYRMDRLGQYWKAYENEAQLTFPAYMNLILEDRQLSRRKLFKRADIPEHIGYPILNGTRRTSNRDRLLQLFLGASMNVEEVRKGLTLYGMAPLSLRNLRDTVFYLAFKDGIWSVDKVNDWLWAYGLEPLKIGIEK